MNFLEALEKQVIIFDGAMGTMIQGLDLSSADFGGESYGMLADLLSFSRPEDLKNIHLAYFRAGANAVETNTFGSSPLRLAEFDFTNIDTASFAQSEYDMDLTKLSYEEIAYYLNRAACDAAEKARKEYRASDEYDGRPLFIIGSIGPSNYVLSSTNADLHKGTWEQIEDNFYHQVCGLVDGGADVVLFETQQDILEVKAAVSGAFKAMAQKGKKLPIMAQITVDQFTRMQIFNTHIHAAITTMQGIGIDTFGINCSIGPDLMEATVEKLSKFCKLPISVLPNAGMPESENGITVYKLGPDELAEQLVKFVTKYGVSIVGGCCGTGPDHIRAVSEALKGITPTKRTPETITYISGPQNAVPVDSSEGLIRIGERLNVRGSKKVRVAVETEGDPIDYDTLEEVVNEQINDLGTGIIDVCMDSNVVDTRKVLPDVIKAMTMDFKGALCLDSFDSEALIEAVKVYPGRPIINSISLEEISPGVSKADHLVSATCFHNPLYIALAADDEGPAVTANKKAEIAGRIVKTCSKYGVTPDQLLIDINAFPIGSESEEGLNFALESLNSISKIKERHRGIKTSIGVSNLTNGLAKKPYMRVVLTSVFLDEARKAGLDAAIVNPNHYSPVESLDRGDYELGLKIVLERDMDAFAELEEIAAVKTGKTKIKKKTYDDLAPEVAVCEKIKDGIKERVAGSVEIEGRTYDYKDRVVEYAARAIERIEPLIFINDYLMEAMKALGDRFAAGEASLPHLLKAADVMKQVMEFLEGYMDCDLAEGSVKPEARGIIVLGTVYQDVHSIGKDLSKTVLENYGYRVIDLGVQVPLEKFIETAIAEKADAIGMSALLVQTSNHMITVAKMMDEAGLDIPIMIGGAPVNMRHAGYVAMRGGGNTDAIKPDVFYCSSAMDAVNIMEAVKSDRKEKFVNDNKKALINSYLRGKNINAEKEVLTKSLPYVKVSFENYSPSAQGYIHEDVEIPLNKLEIDLDSLYGLNWNLGPKTCWKKNGLTPESVADLKNSWIERSTEESWLTPTGIIKLFPCNSVKDEVIIYDTEDNEKEVARILFSPIIRKDKNDLFNPASCFLPADEKKLDVIGLLISTGGAMAKDAVARFKEDNNMASAHMLQGLASRAAEDLADTLHNKLKGYVGVEKNTGARFSPGYPGLTDMKNNRVIFDLLGADKLRIELTEADAFLPTGTTAAIVCFHPEAKYY